VLKPLLEIAPSNARGDRERGWSRPEVERIA
jgi:hypothetical protein